MSKLGKKERENMQFFLLELMRFHIDSVLEDGEPLNEVLNEITDHLNYIEDLK